MAFNQAEVIELREKLVKSDPELFELEHLMKLKILIKRIKHQMRYSPDINIPLIIEIHIKKFIISRADLADFIAKLLKQNVELFAVHRAFCRLAQEQFVPTDLTG
jgi:hypothetical protein